MSTQSTDTTVAFGESLETKDLADKVEVETADQPLGIVEEAVSAEPDLVKVVMIHHHTLADGTNLLPGAEPELPALLAYQLVSASFAKYA